MKAFAAPKKRIISGALILALMLSLCLCALGGATALAAGTSNPSLPGIEQIKRNGGRFDILEIAPAANQGSIGYYVGGSEPTSNWRTELAGLTSKAERTAYVGSLMSSLGNLASTTANAAPLLSRGTYAEVYPWETLPGSTTLPLRHIESVAAAIGNNDIQHVADESGNFQESSSVEISPSQHGNSDQLITAFSNGALAGKYYYYAIVLTAITRDENTLADNTLVYRRIQAGDTTASVDLTYDGANYTRVGVKGLPGDWPGLDEDLEGQYFAATPTGKPSATFNAHNHPYRATGDTFIENPSGRGNFDTENAYDYVGSGGNINIAPGAINVHSGNKNKTLRYSTVLYTGGYVNNNWFKQYVFGYDPSQIHAPNGSIAVAVTTKDIGSVTTRDLDNADLIVITSGTSISGTAASFSNTNDFSSPAIVTDLEQLKDRKPIAIETGLASDTGANLSALATALYGGLEQEFCKGRVYSFNWPLATTAFNNEKYSGNPNFSEVAEDIAYQNFLRERESTPDNPILPLDTSITMAAALRYIIAADGGVTPKTRIRVLDVEPGNEFELGGTDVANWLNGSAAAGTAGATYTAEMVDITHMPIYELVGKMDSLAENYDLIYIGSYFNESFQEDGAHSFYTSVNGWDFLDVFGFWTPEEYNTVYGDSSMNGLVYTNIGDRVVSGADSAITGAQWRLSGLLDRDFKQITVPQEITALNDRDAEAATTGMSRFSVAILFSVDFTFTADISLSSGVLTADIAKTADTGILEYSVRDYTADWYIVGNPTPVGSGKTFDASQAFRDGVINLNDKIYCEARVTNVQGSFPHSATPINSAVSPTYTLDGTLTSVGYAVNVDNDISRTFRYSGNDLSAQMLEELLSYVEGRCPIVYADNLAKYAQSDYDHDIVTSLRRSGNLSSGATASGLNIGWFNITINTVSFGVSASTGQLDGVDTLFMYPTQSTWQQFFTNGKIKRAVYTLHKCDINGNDVAGTAPIPIPVTNGEQASIPISTLTQRGFDRFYCTLTPSVLSKKDGEEETGVTGSPTARSCVYTLHPGVNSERVDVNSRMYTFLESTLNLPNVFSESSALLNNGLLSQYVEVDKPRISFLNENDPKLYPVAYRLENNEMTKLTTDDSEGLYFLEYVFKIENAASATPSSAAYRCNLYLDLDSDGVYSEDELLPDVVIRQSNEDGYKSGSISDTLNQGQYYYLSRVLPTELYGLVPWKLEVVSVSNSLVRASAVGYTRIAPLEEEKKTLNILQVNTSRESAQPSWISTVAGEKLGGVNLERQFGDSSSLFGALNEQVKEDFSLNIITVPADKLEYIHIDTDTDPNYLGASVSEKLPDYRNSLKQGGTQLSFKSVLFSFDLLVLGFDDCYQELSADSVSMIAEYLEETDKAVLFSHDNASIFALKDDALDSNGNRLYLGNFGTGTLNTPPAFGFDFNRILRDRLGLDRYGVTSTKTVSDGANSTQIGQSRYWRNILGGGDYSGAGGPVANSYSDFTTRARLEQIAGLGYDIAYLPSKNPTDRGGSDPAGMPVTVPETQGLTKAVLARYLVSGHYPTYPGTDFLWRFDNTLLTLDRYSSNAITQVNNGQITTYPFDLNTAGFGGVAGDDNTSNPRLSKIPISTTHFQYHQLNLNPAGSGERTVVWYCLADGVYDYIPNDVVNDYYIYTRGNVTYTGFGHSAADFEIPYTSASEGMINEAKLLINTLIAAYRVSESKPAVRFTDRTGANELTSFLVPYDAGVESGVLIPNAAITGKQTYNDTARYVYFTVYDANPGKKRLSVTFRYRTQAASGTSPDVYEDLPTLPVYDAQSGAAVVAGVGLRSGATYYVRLDDLLGVTIPGSGDTFSTRLKTQSSVPVSVVLKTQKLDGEENPQPVGAPLESAPETLTLRRLELFKLG